MAAVSIANIVKTSLGPVGLDKMLVDDVGVSSTIINWSGVCVCVCVGHYVTTGVVRWECVFGVGGGGGGGLLQVWIGSTQLRSSELWLLREI